MANQGNRHCANCIGAHSFPIKNSSFMFGQKPYCISTISERQVVVTCPAALRHNVGQRIGGHCNYSALDR